MQPEFSTTEKYEEHNADAHSEVTARPCSPEFTLFKQLSEQLDKGATPAFVCAELGELLENNISLGLKLLSALCHQHPGHYEFAQVSAYYCLQFLHIDRAAPAKIFDLGISALAAYFSPPASASPGAEYLFMFASYAPNAAARIKLLSAAEFHLRRTIAETDDVSKINRARAFLAKTLSDLSVASGSSERHGRLTEALKLIDNVPSGERFAFLDLVEGQICLALADYYDNQESNLYSERAVLAFRAALVHTENDTDCLHGIVNAYILWADSSAGPFAEDLLNQASDYASRLLEAEPTNPDAFCALGNIHSIQANFKEGEARRTQIERARGYFDKALLLDPRHINSLQGLGNQAISLAERPLLGEWKEQVNIGQKAFESILEIDPTDYNASHGLATIHRFRLRGNSDPNERKIAYDEATRLLSECITQHPTRVTSYLSLGAVIRESIVFSKGERGEQDIAALQTALKYYQKALELSPRDIYVQLAIISVKTDLLITIEDPKLIIQSASRLASQLRSLAPQLEQSRSVVQSYSALLNMTEKAMFKVDTEFPSSFMLEHIEKINQFEHSAIDDLSSDPIKYFEFAARSETLIAFEAYAHFSEGEFDRAAHTIESRTGRYFRENRGQSSSHATRAHSDPGTEIYLWSAERGAVALIRTPDGFLPIEIPDASRGTLLKRIAKVEDAYIITAGTKREDMRLGGSSQTDQSADAWNSAIVDLTEWLGTALAPLWNTLSEIGATDIDWIAQGLWSFCPLHAALLPGGNCAFEQFKMRYRLPGTPDRAALTGADAPPDRIVVFADPDYIDQPRLQFGPLEIEAFESLKNRRQIDVPILRGKDASKDAFLALSSELLGDSVLHLSCHGRAAANDPQNCLLYLTADQTINLGEVLRHEAFSNTRLVFLSSCESGFRSRYVMDEAIAMHTAFLASGAHNTINALWAVSDKMTYELTERFYDHLLDSGDINSSLAKACSWVKKTYGANGAHVWAGFQHWHAN